MSSANKSKKVHSSKHREEKELSIEERILKIEQRVLRVEEAAQCLENNFDEIVAHVNQEPVRVLSSPNPPMYSV